MMSSIRSTYQYSDRPGYHSVLLSYHLLPSELFWSEPVLLTPLDGFPPLQEMDIYVALEVSFGWIPSQLLRDGHRKDYSGVDNLHSASSFSDRAFGLPRDTVCLVRQLPRPK